MDDAWLNMRAAELGREIEMGGIDPRDLTEAFLAAIDTHVATEQVYSRVTPDRARAEASAAAERARAGLRRGPLDGVPISWKDLFDSAGVTTEAGSRLLAGRVPKRDAEVLARGSRAGLVCLGKTHMSELAFSGLGVNPSTATSPNVFAAARAPGGSSSGAAASVAHGLAAAGIGSDTGGSVRIPSAWNGLTGLKSTHGLLPLDGVVPLCPRFDTIGPLCRSVEDAALLLAALSGRPTPDLRGAEITGKHLAVLETPGLSPVDPAPTEAFSRAVVRLEVAGARITTISPDCVDAALSLSGCLFTSEAYGFWRDAIEADPEAMFAQVRDRFLLGASFSAADYVAAWRRLDALRADYLHAVAGFDAVLLATAPILPPVVDSLLKDPDYFTKQNLLTLRNTRVANLLGLCALTLPTDTDACGLMAMAPPREEARLLRLGAAMEQTLKT